MSTQNTSTALWDDFDSFNSVLCFTDDEVEITQTTITQIDEPLEEWLAINAQMKKISALATDNSTGE